jgi:hypothetical protein
MNENMESPIMADGHEMLRRAVEAYIIGRVEALRVSLEFFIEDVKAIPPRTFPERFGGILVDTDNLLIDIKAILNRPPVGSGPVEAPEEAVTDEMVEAAKQAMSWEGSVIPEEEQASLMRDVLAKALASKNNTAILL